MTSGCDFTRQRLPWFAGEELPSDELRQVRGHLRDCPTCRGLASSFLQARRALQGAGAALSPTANPPFFADLRAGILARVGAEPLPEAGQHGPARRWQVLRWAAAALLLGAIAAVAWPMRSGGLLARRAIPSAGIVVSPYAGPGAQPMQPLGHEAVGDSRSQGMRGRAELRSMFDREEPRSPSWLRAFGKSGEDAVTAGILTGLRRSR